MVLVVPCLCGIIRLSVTCVASFIPACCLSQLVIINVVVERAIMLIDMFDLTDVMDGDSRVSHYMGIDSVIQKQAFITGVGDRRWESKPKCLLSNKWMGTWN